MQRIATGNALLSPMKILNEGGVSYGQVVADLGTGGAGYFALQAAKMVGDKGRVYGVDVLKAALSNLMSRAKMAGLINIIPVWTNLEIVGAAKPILDASVDVGVLVNVLHQSKEKRLHILREAFRMTKHEGKLIIVDWKKSGAPMGPGIHLRITQDDILKTAREAGFELDHAFAPGDYHWGMILTKP